jgi:hypothetical protein
MRKGLNNCVARGQLTKAIEEKAMQLEAQRYLTTPKGQALLAHRKHEKELEERRKEFTIGQLVWNDEIMDDKTNLDTGGRIVSRANKIIAVNHDSVQVEMIFIKDSEEKKEWFLDWTGYTHTKGEEYAYEFYQLEKHIAKNGNVWWKVK